MASTTGRLVREDGSASVVAITDYSLRGCHVPHELPQGELVSVEFTDIALLVGQVTSVHPSGSRIMFMGSGSH